VNLDQKEVAKAKKSGWPHKQTHLSVKRGRDFKQSTCRRKTGGVFFSETGKGKPTAKRIRKIKGKGRAHWQKKRTVLGDTGPCIKPIYHEGMPGGLSRVIVGIRKKKGKTRPTQGLSSSAKRASLQKGGYKCILGKQRLLPWGNIPKWGGLGEFAVQHKEGRAGEKSRKDKKKIEKKRLRGNIKGLFFEGGKEGRGGKEPIIKKRVFHVRADRFPVVR